MNLFNEYNNKNINRLIHYCNMFYQNPGTALSINNMCEQLQLSDQLTSSEIINSVFNRNEDYTNLYWFFLNEETDTIDPIWQLEKPLPYLTTSAERAWLMYILNDSRSDIFIRPDDKADLLECLNREATQNSVCNKLLKFSDYIDIRNKNVQEDAHNILETSLLRNIVERINAEQYIELTYDNTTFDVLPYKIQYNWETDSFALMAIKQEDEAKQSGSPFTFYDISLISAINNSKYGKYMEYDHNNLPYEIYFNECLERSMVQTPIHVKVMNYRLTRTGIKKLTDAGNRFNHLFSDYRKISNIDEDGNLLVDIHYYEFQYSSILQKLLMMGKYIEVISPQPVRQEIIRILKEKVKLYE